MKFGFDLDGTLDRTQIRLLSNALYEAGHEVHVITGGMTDTGEWTMAARIAKCDSLGIMRTAIHRAFGPDLHAIGLEKARILKELGIGLMFEDSSSYIRAIDRTALCCFVVNNPKEFHLKGGE